MNLPFYYFLLPLGVCLCTFVITFLLRKSTITPKTPPNPYIIVPMGVAASITFAICALTVFSVPLFHFLVFILISGVLGALVGAVMSTKFSFARLFSFIINELQKIIRNVITYSDKANCVGKRKYRAGMSARHILQDSVIEFFADLLGDWLGSPPRPSHGKKPEDFDAQILDDIPQAPISIKGQKPNIVLPPFRNLNSDRDFLDKPAE